LAAFNPESALLPSFDRKSLVTMRFGTRTSRNRLENGRVFLPKGTRWLDDYVIELIGFPDVKHDDQVDSTTQALDYLHEPDIVAQYIRTALPVGSRDRTSRDRVAGAPDQAKT
jgi:hypothetical protein